MRTVLIAITATLLITIVSCSDGRISREAAISIASNSLPANAVAQSKIDASLDSREGEHGTWFVVFNDLWLTREELGWQEDDITSILGISMGYYTSASVEIDAVTGSITRRTARFSHWRQYRNPDGTNTPVIPPVASLAMLH
jgi:hypothetical protein